MTPTKKIIEMLERQKALMDALGDRRICGFALIVPPDGEPVEIVTLGTEMDAREFYTQLADRMKTAGTKDQYGFVRTPGAR